MNGPRWYVIGTNGVAKPAESEWQARLDVQDSDHFFPKYAPHRAVQLVDVAELAYRDARIAELEAEVVQLTELAKVAATAWDSDADHKVGKLLRAMTCKEFRAVYKPRLAEKLEGERC